MKERSVITKTVLKSDWCPTHINRDTGDSVRLNFKTKTAAFYDSMDLIQSNIPVNEFNKIFDEIIFDVVEYDDKKPRPLI